MPLELSSKRCTSFWPSINSRRCTAALRWTLARTVLQQPAQGTPSLVHVQNILPLRLLMKHHISPLAEAEDVLRAADSASLPPLPKA